MKRSIAMLLLITPIFLLSGVAIGQTDDGSSDTPKEVNKSDVLEWLDQLDADKLSERKAAEKALIDAGLGALEFLPEKRAGFSIEATERLARVRAALVSLKAKSQAKAIRIRFGDAKTLGEALEVISAESGVEFDHMADESIPVQPPTTPLSFWHAVDVVLDQTSLDINAYGSDSETLKLVPRAEGRQSRVDSAAYSGVYRLEPVSVSSRRVYNSPEQNGLNLSMQITWQPGMTPIGLTIPVNEVRGKYDDQGTLRPQTTQDSIEIATNNEMAFSEFFLPLELPVDRPKDIATLQGTIQSLLPGKQHDFEFDLTKPGTKQTVDSMTVELEQVSRNGDLYEVRIAIDLEDADRALESHRQWIFQNELRVTDRDGIDRDQLGYELYRQTDSAVGLAYFFDIERIDGAKLIYRSPTSVTKNTVEFVLEDIDLP
ncbi:MAG: hypothetical protein AAFX06_32850 [Planctomycetota bacterium]